MVIKTKAMHASYKMEMNNLLLMHVDGNDIEWVNSCIYLGIQLSAGGFITKEVTRRIGLA